MMSGFWSAFSVVATRGELSHANLCSFFSQKNGHRQNNSHYSRFSEQRNETTFDRDVISSIAKPFGLGWCGGLWVIFSAAVRLEVLFF